MIDIESIIKALSLPRGEKNRWSVFFHGLRPYFLKIWLVALLGLFFIGWKWYDDSRLDRRFDEEGVRVEGVVRVKETSTRDDGETLYWIRAEYSPGYRNEEFEMGSSAPSGRRHFVHQPVYAATYNGAKVGEPIDVVYLPGDVENARVNGERFIGESLELIMAFVGGLGLIFFVLWKIGGEPDRDGSPVSPSGDSYFP